ncbi:MAG: 4-alpha-glucanotransferase, partial [Treponema sp.]|nr:4-alpha-glucanotransferase [Treponema sp.]
MKFTRSSGILMHPTSFAGTPGIGTLGKAAYDFVDWLELAHQTLWQILPIGPTGYGDSPYASFSTFAGNPLMIDLDRLVEKGWAD